MKPKGDLKKLIKNNQVGVLFYFNLDGKRVYLTDCKLKDAKDMANEVIKGTPLLYANHPDVFFSFNGDDYLVASDDGGLKPDAELHQLVLMAWHHGYDDGVNRTVPFIAKDYRDKIIREFKQEFKEGDD